MGKERPAVLTEDRYKSKILTIPNLLSFFRICLIPVIVWLYVGRRRYGLAAAVLALSGATDVVDGFIARRFHMVSDFGKAFDPVADKLTQFAMLLCLVTRFRSMLLPLVILVAKELFALVTSLMTIKKTGQVLGAVWHGKAATVCLYAAMFVHLVWYAIPAVVSDLLIGACAALMLLSAVLYGIRNVKILAAPQHQDGRNQ